MSRIALIVLLLLFSSSKCEPGKKKEFRFYEVVTVIDGDTFRINDGTLSGLKVRLIGVDAPETRNTANKVKSEFGEASKSFLVSMLEGRRVRLEYDVDRTDKYGRTLAYVYLEDGTFVNAELVKRGYATILTIPPNVRYQELFLRLERKARAADRGLWNNR